MTTIINANTSAGLTQTADTSGIIKVQSNGVTTNALAYVAYNGVGQAILSSYNVSSVTYGGTGSYTVNFTNAFANTSYCIAMGSSTNNSGGLNATYCTASSTTAVGVGTYSIAGGGAGAYRDTNGVYIVVFAN